MNHRRSLLVLVLACTACGKSKPSAIAELARADGPVEREQGKGPWNAAAIGAEFFVGDAAKTADGGAQLRLAGSAQLAMRPKTILRFGGTAQRIDLRAELGGAKLSGGGEFSLSIGNVKLGDKGELLITANDVTLTAGAGTLRDVNGTVTDMTLNVPLAFGLGSGTITVRPDAAVDAAPPDAPDDAGTPAAEATLEADGKHVEVQLPGEKKPKPVDGQVTLPVGAKVSVGAKSKATLVANGVTLRLGPASRATVGPNLVFAVEQGGGTASATADGAVGVPGGVLGLKPTKDGPAEAHVAVERNGLAKVKVTKPAVTLDGGNGRTLDLGRDESAAIEKSGTIHPDVVIPAYFDFALPAGESATVHDPRPPTAVKFDFGGKCPAGGVVELDHDTRFRAPRISRSKEGEKSANFLVQGAWYYRVHCGEETGRVVALARLVVIRDDGRRALPAKDPTYVIDAVLEGRPINFGYQSQIPSFEFHVNGKASRYTLHLLHGSDDATFSSSTPVVTVPAKQLHEGLYSFQFERDGVKGKAAPLTIGFDNTAAQVYIESPPNGQPFGSEVHVKVTVVPGWTSAKVDGTDLPADAQHRFIATVDPPPGRALAIRLYNAKRGGVHYFLCKP